jgi:hypothetical protein
LAQINVSANSTTITSANITDQRKIKNTTDSNANNLALHSAENASQSQSGHVKVDGSTITANSGVISANSATAMFKPGSGSFNNGTNTQTFTDTFCTATSLVQVTITSSTAPVGTWTVNSAAGSFTITSTMAETNAITFNYFIIKTVVG